MGVLHRVNKMKLLYNTHGGMKGASQCKYFALMWIPSNNEDGMNENEFKELIIALRKSQYFVNKLNKESVYISGPSYGNNEDFRQNESQNFDESDEKFDLAPLVSMCRSMCDQTDIDLDIEV